MKKVVLLSAALLVAGCGEKSNEEKSDIIGKWVVREQAGIQFTNDKTWYHFMDDGKVVMNAWSKHLPGNGTTSSNGTWKLEGNVITTIFSGDLDGEPFEMGYAFVIKSSESGRMVLSMDFLDLESGAPYTGDGSEGIETVLEKEYAGLGREEGRVAPEVAPAPSDKPGPTPKAETKDAAQVDPASASEAPKSLSDSDLERLLEVAIEMASLQRRNGLYYQVNKSKPYSGWTKEMYDSGQVKGLSKFKDGKPADGLHTQWYENGQKSGERTYKDGKMEGLWTTWHENGQKRREGTFKDGEKVSAKYWNSKGEEQKDVERSEALLKALEGIKPKPKPVPRNYPVPLLYPNAPDSLNTPEDSVTLPLSDADVKRLLKEAVKVGLLAEKPPYESGLRYKVIGTEGGKFKYQSDPYSGWVKSMSLDERKLVELYQMKGGKWHGPRTEWHENGQKKLEATYKDDEEDGSYMKWHENGQKQFEITYKDGEEVSGKYWNRKGEEVATKRETHAAAVIANPVVEIITSMGSIHMELNKEKAPISVANFLAYVKDKHYDGTIFHRVIDGFMIQGGGFAKGDVPTQKETQAPIKNEAKTSGLSNLRGTIAMARTQAPDSATAQFFINLVDNKNLDAGGFSPDGYAVFGKVVSGMEIVDKIRGVRTGSKHLKTTRGLVNGGDVPLEPVIIESIALKK